MKRIFTSFMFLTMCVLLGFAQTLKLNGVDQYMSIPNDAVFFPADDGSITATCRVKTSVYLNEARALCTRAHAGTDNGTTVGYELVLGNEEGLNWHTFEPIQQLYASANTSIAGKAWGNGNDRLLMVDGLDRWIHMAYVYDRANNKVVLYLDAERSNAKSGEIGANFQEGTMPNHGLDILVGADWNCSENGVESALAHFLKGEIDDVHFYNRALTQEEVATDMNNFDLMTAQNLVAAYDFEYVSGNTVPDVSNNGHNGTLHGFQVEATKYTVNKDAATAQGYIKVMNGTEMLWGGESLAEGTVLTLEAIVLDSDYELDYFTANGEKIEGNTYTVNGDVTLGVVFKQKVVEPEVPTEPVYAIPEGDNNLRQNTDQWGQPNSREYERLLYSVTLNGATNNGVPAPFESVVTEPYGGQKYVFVDKTADVADITAGDQITVDMEHGIEWMHGYLYIDYNHDGVFDIDTELVSFSHYSADNTEDGVNSLGEPTKSNCGIALPGFTVKADAQEVTTRMRLKIDWNSKNPVGSETQSIGANAGFVVDFTVNVHAGAPVVKNYAVNFSSVCEGGSFKVMNGEEEVVSGTEVAEGTVLTIVPTAEEGYEFAGYIINEGSENEQFGEAPFDGPITFTVDGEINLVAFFDVAQYAITLVQPANGQVAVTYPYGELEDGSMVGHGEEITIVATANEGYELENYLVNEVAQAEDKVIVTGPVTISATFKEAAVVEPTYAIPEGDDNIRAKADGTVRFSERLLHTVTVEGATLNGEAAPFTSTINEAGGRQENVFVDKTAETVELTSGDNVQLTFTHDIIWMHSYLYIDYNHDGVFNEDNELVAYSHFSEFDTPDGFNSLGEPTKHDCGIDIPAFTVAEVAKDVKTRMRLKIDWNSKNPVGNETQSIGGNAGTIVDFTVNVHAKGGETPAPEGTVKLTYEANAGGEVYIMDPNGTPVESGVFVKEGARGYAVLATPADGKAPQFFVNDVDKTAGSFEHPMLKGSYYLGLDPINETTHVKIVFGGEGGEGGEGGGEVTDDHVVTYDVTAGGSLTLEDYGTDRILKSGDTVAHEAFVVATVKADEGYKLASFMVNDQERIGEMNVNGNEYSMALTIAEDTEIFVGFAQTAAKGAVVTYTFDSSMCDFTVRTKDEYGQSVYLNSGDTAPRGSNLNCSVYPEPGYTLESVYVNGNLTETQHMTWGGDYYIFGIQNVQENVNIVVNMKADGDVAKCAVTYSGTEGGTVSLKDNQTEVTSGSEVVAGSVLTLYMTPEEGYELTSVMVNEEEMIKSCEVLMSGSRMLVLHIDAATDIKVTFSQKAVKHTLTYSVSEGGTAKITIPGLGQVESGATFEDLSTIIVEMTPAEGYDLESVYCNDGNMIGACSFIPWGGYYQLMLRDISNDMNIEITFASKETGIGEVSLAEVAYNAASETINVPAGANAMVYNAAGQLVLTAEGGNVVSTAALANGAYILRVASANAVKVVKFIKK